MSTWGIVVWIVEVQAEAAGNKVACHLISVKGIGNKYCTIRQGASTTVHGP